MLDEFKKFIFKGNVVDLSTGVIIGAAFGDIVKAFTDGIVKPLINKLGGGTAEVKYFLFGVFDVGTLISAVINFVMVAAVVFFLIVKPMNHAMALMKSKEAAAPPPGPTPTEALLTEIRDALKK